jgi:hypothetical protein
MRITSPKKWKTLAKAGVFFLTRSRNFDRCPDGRSAKFAPDPRGLGWKLPGYARQLAQLAPGLLAAYSLEVAGLFRSWQTIFRYQSVIKNVCFRFDKW